MGVSNRHHIFHKHRFNINASKYDADGNNPYVTIVRNTNVDLHC